MQGGGLSYEEFKMWVLRTPELMAHIESILPYNGPKDTLKHVDKQEIMPHDKRMSSRNSVSGRSSINLGIIPPNMPIIDDAGISSALAGRSRNVSMNEGAPLSRENR